ncbi:hypothetical protein [Desulfatitalea tepidiphila]|uniref:hypothetical protein n=1 Tax=Desulfatitalea tepidiphila TaxID=1185843 RepID=UPI0006B668A4|nr:hypothetical protein [Desulfatitalea tepidiphila]
MTRLILILVLLMAAVGPAAADPSDPAELKDLYFGEALYHAFQESWFDAIARLDAELAQHGGVDEPELDTLYHHLNEARFDVGDFELAYRMHRRAGRAITAVIEGNVPEKVRNAAIYRLARIYFQKDQPLNALYAIDRIGGDVPDAIREDVAFLRAQILMANGRFADAAKVLQGLQDARSLKGFSTYNLGIALLRDGNEQEGRRQLDRAGQVDGAGSLIQAIKDKSNLVLGSKLMAEQNYENAKLVLDRVHLSGPFSNRALLGSGWADAYRDDFQRALVPWSILVTREVTDASVQEALLALPYAYGKLAVHAKAAILYGHALEKFGTEIDKLDASVKRIREGHFLEALVREELKQDANWVVRLRELPQSPETYYLLDLMASHDFQESLKNYLDLEGLRKRLSSWTGDLEAFEEIIAHRRAYYQPLLPDLDRAFRQLDSRMRLRLEQRDRIEKRLQAMLVVPRPDYLATSAERILGEGIAHLAGAADTLSAADVARIRRLRGVLDWNMYTDYDRRLTEAHTHLRDLNDEVALMQRQYTVFVRTRQAASQSYEGYGDTIRRLRSLIRTAGEKVDTLMARQGNMLEGMAVSELTRRRERLAEFQIKARFALADSYDRATRAQTEERVAQ